MGYIRPTGMLVSGNDAQKKLSQAFEKANEYLGQAVTPMHYGINGYVSFAVLWDGSKEGWSESDYSDKMLEEFIEYLKKENEFLYWVYIYCIWWR